jgi:hypothetical protein
MTSQIKTAAFAIVLVASSTAFAQVQGVQVYDHHSTVFGDWQAGTAERLNAEGNFAQAIAAAEKQHIENAAAYEDYRYQYVQHYYQAKELKRQDQAQRRDDKVARQSAAAAAEETAAIRLWKSAQQGIVNWPSALTRPEFSSSMSTVESILRNWSPSDNATSGAYRQALATEAGVLRAKVMGNDKLSFSNKVEAVKTLAKLQTLATATDLAEVSPQLAMR